MAANEIEIAIKEQIADISLVAGNPSLFCELMDATELPDGSFAMSAGVQEKLTQAASTLTATLLPHDNGTVEMGLYSPNGDLIAQTGSNPKVPQLHLTTRKSIAENVIAFEPLHFKGEELVLPTTLPVTDRNGKILGLLRSQISLSYAFTMLSNRLDVIFEEASIHLTLVNQDGGAACRIDTNSASGATRLPTTTLIGGRDKALTVFRRDHHDNRRLVTSIASPQVTDGPARPFYLVFDEPYEKAMLPARDMRNTIIATSCVLLALVYIAAVCMTTEFFRRIDVLQDAITSLDSGEYEIEVAAECQSDLDRLAQSINSLSRTLKNKEEHSQQSQANGEALQAKLELQAQRLTSQVEKTAELEQKVEQAKRSRNYFLSAMSCEIRTPLNSILGYIELLKGTGDRKNKSFIDELSTSGQHLLTTIDDILDLSVIEGNHIETRVMGVELLPMLHEATSRFPPRANQKGLDFTITFEGQVPTSINTDASRLRQVLLNLIGNAINYTIEGAVDLRVRCEAGQSSMLAIDIRDTGPGIAEERLSTLFETIDDTHRSKVRREGWSGFGLRVSKKVALSLGGDITVSSTVGEGSCFHFSLDSGDTSSFELIEKPNEKWQQLNVSGTTEKRVDPATRKKAPLNCRILLAEDSPDNQRLMTLFLKRMGADVTVVENGQLAVDALLNQGDEEPFALVLLDMQMPVLDGYSAAWQLRSLGRTEPIVAVTAHAMPGERKKCLVAGCNDFIAKPINHDEFEKVVRKWANASVEDEPSATRT